MNENEAKTKNEGKKKSPMAPIHGFLIQAFVIVVLLWVGFGLIFGLKTMPNNDMHPRIDQGDLLFFYRLDKTHHAQDVVVFQKNGTTYVGRVIASPGDKVEITETGNVLVNDRNVIEPDIFFSTPPYEGFVEYPVQLGQSQYFVLADMRDGGEDSRYFGPIDAGDIKGVVLAVLRRHVI